MRYKFEQVAALKKGDVVWECSQYGSIQVELLEDAVVEDVLGDHASEGEQKVTFTAKVVNKEGGREINYLLNNKHMHYGPKLYKENEYMTIEEYQKWLRGE